MTPQRRSPLHAELERLEPRWADLHGMPVAVRLPNESAAHSLALCDLSCLPHVGLKGPQAVTWLNAQGVSTPEQINTWQQLAEGGLIARLGMTEFLIEDDFARGASARIKAALRNDIAGVYPVLRQDAALALSGARVNELLLETCSVNFLGFPFDERRAIMTSMVGVSVTIVRWLRGEAPLYRIWCDGSFGPYLWETLLEVARDLGGGAIGVQALFPEWKIEQD